MTGMEKITVVGKAGGVDDDGYPLPSAKDRTVSVKSVQPLSLEEMAGIDRDGVVDALRVWALDGVSISEGDTVRIRGLDYRVETTAWDWSKNRRPALARHRPSTVFDCVRGAG